MSKEEQGSSRDLSPSTNAHRADGGVHTPGPWHAIGDTVFSGGRGQHFIASCDVGVANFGNRRFNARLIASAPDLLESLQEALEFAERLIKGAREKGIDLDLTADEMLRDWRIAITKATESPSA